MLPSGSRKTPRVSAASIASSHVISILVPWMSFAKMAPAVSLIVLYLQCPPVHLKPTRYQKVFLAQGLCRWQISSLPNYQAILVVYV